MLGFIYLCLSHKGENIMSWKIEKKVSVCVLLLHKLAGWQSGVFVAAQSFSLVLKSRVIVSQIENKMIAFRRVL